MQYLFVILEKVAVSVIVVVSSRYDTMYRPFLMEGIYFIS